MGSLFSSSCSSCCSCCRQWFRQPLFSDGEGLSSELTNLPRYEPVYKPQIELDENMSAPTIRITNDGMTASGYGLVIAASDAVNASAGDGDEAFYWEWHLSSSTNESLRKRRNGEESETNTTTTTTTTTSSILDVNECMFGVSTQRNKDFYEIMSSKVGTDLFRKQCTKWMRSIPDLQTSFDNPAVGVIIIGVAIDMKTEPSPTIQLYVNGELKDDFQLSRFRGNLYPSLWLPFIHNKTDDKNDDSMTKKEEEDIIMNATFVHDEEEFIQLTPHARYQPLKGTNNKKNNK